MGAEREARSPLGARGPADPAQELILLREQLMMTPHEMAAVAGVSEEELAEMEAGRRPVPQELLAELMEELNAKGA